MAEVEAEVVRIGEEVAMAEEELLLLPRVKMHSCSLLMNWVPGKKCAIIV